MVMLDDGKRQYFPKNKSDTKQILLESLAEKLDIFDEEMNLIGTYFVKQDKFVQKNKNSSIGNFTELF